MTIKEMAVVLERTIYNTPEELAKDLAKMFCIITKHQDLDHRCPICLFKLAKCNCHEESEDDQACDNGSSL